MLIRRTSRAWVAVLVLSAAVVTGCTTRLAYNNADFLIERYVDEYVEFDDAQQPVFDRRLAELLAWHRDSELPAYVAWVGTLRRGVEAGAVTSAEVQSWTDELVGFWDRLSRRLAPDMVVLGEALTDAQVDALLERIREGQAERVAEVSERVPERAVERRSRGMERFLRRWAGSLSDAQEAQIEAWASRMVPTTVLWLENRQGWIDEFDAALRDRSDRAALEAAVERLIVNPSVRWNDAYRQAIEANSAATSEFLAAFINGMTPRQRARADDRLGDLQADLAALAVSP